MVGGDILTVDSKKLMYAYHVWGSEYHCLNWCCEKLDKETPDEYVTRSYDVAKDAIRQADDVAKRIKMECVIVLVI